MRKSNLPMTLVIKPVKISPNGSVLESNPIITGHDKEESALKEAIEYSGLGRFASWNFLIFGRLSRGKILKDKDYDKQVSNIQRSRFYERRNSK